MMACSTVTHLRTVVTELAAKRCVGNPPMMRSARIATLGLCGVILVVLLAGCVVAGSAASDPSRMPGISGAALGTIDTVSGLDSSHALTSEESEWLYLSSLAQDAKESGISDPPAVARVRFIRPDEMGQTRVACLAELGIPAVSKADGYGYAIGDVPDSQQKALNESQYVCAAKYPIHPQYVLTRSPEARGRQYDWMANEQIPCLRSRGFSIADPPSKAVWLASYDLDPWIPEKELPRDLVGSESKRAELEKACPIPPVDQLIEHPPILPLADR